MEKEFHLSDRILLIVLVLFGIFLTVFIYLPSKSEGERLEVRQNGTVVMTLSLAQDTEKTIMAGDGGTNTFAIKDGIVTMTAADCGDKTCINTGSISQTGETIVCLPHRLVLAIVGGNKSKDVPDAIVK